MDAGLPPMATTMLTYAPLAVCRWDFDFHAGYENPDVFNVFSSIMMATDGYLYAGPGLPIYPLRLMVTPGASFLHVR